MVLLAPSWRALQDLLFIVQQAADDIRMSFNTRKTVCMIFNPCNRRKIVCNSFPAFSLAGCQLFSSLNILDILLISHCLMMLTLAASWSRCSLEPMCCVGDLNVALHKLKCNCSDLFVFVFMIQLYGAILLPLLWISWLLATVNALRFSSM
jgi:hypothetical protein